MDLLYDITQNRSQDETIRLVTVAFPPVAGPNL